ncbi:facilitated trehalose transporter Tret1-like [Sitodiplosis mosellana]|uniref:facilitated trehalose transporter Tret1-like n=1 Tax=Sitodiplosis mosellana TaxID=263140 RepID=UPI0024448C5E|nr:facilitated trehalose transporter Tret1-like [Sitodiplosis mosellana]XP_055303203.1 facilitated trehalose transporter Tret1-like [Sitodiplosis mosellana]XP_055303204.1 facilitated trehalose transporter Tret1-like [Sitodiplosis mosellana]
MSTTEKSNEKRCERDGREKVDKFRRFLAQFCATTVENLLLFDMGLCHSFPFIIIAALTGFPNKHNLNETLSLTPIEASWLASIGYISEPIGSLLSALITDALGRKVAMMVVNIPLVVAWFLMYSASSVWQIFLAIVLLGLGAGLMESPIITYVGEISEPTFRGVMIAYTHFGYSLGAILVATLNIMMPWRMVGLVCMFTPIFTTIALCFVPETPLWLLSKNKTAQAEKALCWLRGWVPKESVAEELQSLQRYSERYKSCESCIKKDQKCIHPLPTLAEKLKELKRKQTLKPFSIVMALFCISVFSTTFSMSTYIVQILKAYNIPMEPDEAAAVLSYVNNLGNISFLCLIRFTGKRYLYLTILSILFLSAAVICGYGFMVLPIGYSSFPDLSPNFPLENSNLGYIPFVCIILSSFCIFCGINSMAWQMISEVFPYKTRGTATGLTAALSYVLSFIGAKTFYSLETTLSMPGVALFNCIIIAFGLILMYKILPETENRTLEDIEMHFSDNSKKLTDRKIPKLDLSQIGSAKNNSNMPTRPVSIKGIDEQNNKKSGIGCDNRSFVADS